ncbi:MAG: hypothetical protein AAGI68_17195 [Planctomycetota bacterium]
MQNPSDLQGCFRRPVTAWVTLLLLCGILLLNPFGVRADPADAVRPVDDPDLINLRVETHHDLYRVRLAFFQRHLTEAYRMAVHTPSPATLALFELAAQGSADDGITREYLPPIQDQSSVPKFEAAVERVLAKPELDTWDHLALSRAYAWLGEDAAREKHAMGAIAMLEPDHEPQLHPLLRYHLYRNLGQRNRAAPPPGFEGRMRDLYDAAIVQTAQGPFVHPAERRVIYREIWSQFMDDLNAEWRNRLIPQIQQHPDSDPWIVAAFVGAHEIETAWEKRGTGFAHTVDEEGWMGFAEHLALARKSLMRAVEIDPHHPEPFTELITVAMGGETKGAESPRYWFDRAREAQYDWYRAYTNLLWATRPRWGGSHAEMRKIAEMVLEEGRFDTRVPLILIQAYTDIQSERDEDEPVIWLEPDVMRNVGRYYRNRTELYQSHPEIQRVDLSAWAVASYLAGDYQKAGELLGRVEAIDGGFMDKAWVWRDVQFGDPFAMDELRARSGPVSEILAEVEADAERLEPSDAARRLAQFAATLNPGLPAQTVAHRAAFAHRAEEARVSDEPLNLLGPHPVSLFREVGSAEWVRQIDGSITGIGTRKTTIRERERYLHTEKLFGRDLRIRARVRLEPLRGDREPNVSVLFGMYEKSNGADLYHTVQFIHDPDEPHRHRVEIGWRYHWHRERFNRPIPLEFEFQVEYVDQHVTVWIDGEKVGTTEKPLKYAASGSSPRAVGLGFRVYEPQQTVHFEVLEVTELD